jgi:beta-barrel assembly-enhancing protease
VRRALAFVAAALTLSGCAGWQDMAKSAMGSSLKGSRPDMGSMGQSAYRTGSAIKKASEDLTDEQEYFVGRAVAAQIFGKYEPSKDAELNRYVRKLGQAVAMVSDRPETFNGYRFIVLETKEPNAFAAPGGFVFITKGLIAMTRSEDELAGALAHEVAHVNLKHGLGTISSARKGEVVGIILAEAGKNSGVGYVSKLTGLFEGMITDVSKTLLSKGYSRDSELAADALGAEIAKRAGYDPRGLSRMIARLGSVPSKIGMLKTHPSPQERVQKLSSVATPGAYRSSSARDQRFKAAAGA